MTKYTHTLEEYKIVMHILRHNCKRIRNFDKAVQRIVKLSDIPEEKVKKILREMFKD